MQNTGNPLNFNCGNQADQDQAEAVKQKPHSQAYTQPNQHEFLKPNRRDKKIKLDRGAPSTSQSCSDQLESATENVELTRKMSSASCSNASSGTSPNKKSKRGKKLRYQYLENLVNKEQHKPLNVEDFKTSTLAIIHRTMIGVLVDRPHLLNEYKQVFEKNFVLGSNLPSRRLLDKYQLRSSRAKKPCDSKHAKKTTEKKRVKTLPESKPRLLVNSTPKVSEKPPVSSTPNKMTPVRSSSKFTLRSISKSPAKSSSKPTSKEPLKPPLKPIMKKPLKELLKPPLKSPLKPILKDPLKPLASTSSKASPKPLKHPSKDLSWKDKPLLNQSEGPGIPKILAFDFKIPKKSKISSSSRAEESSTQSSDKDISSNTTLNVASKPPKSLDRVTITDTSKSEEDFDLLETDDPELDFDIYGANDSDLSVDNELKKCSLNEEESEPTGTEIEQEMALDDPKPQSDDFLERITLQAKVSIDDLFNDSESSDDEGNFKRRGSKGSVETSEENYKIEPKVSPRKRPFLKTGESSNISPVKPDTSTRSRIMPPSGPSKNISLRCKTPAIPGEIPIDEIIAAFDKIKNPSDAMKKFIQTQQQYPKSFVRYQRRFQNLFQSLLVNLFSDITFHFEKKHVDTLIAQLDKLEMNSSHYWEQFICEWGKRYPSVCPDPKKKENISHTINYIYNYLQTTQTLINLHTARYLFEMK